MTSTPSTTPGEERPRIYNGRYELIRQIARGGTAQVYLARDLLLDRPVGLKVLFPELSNDSTFVDRFRREAQAAANLSHPNIVPVFDWGESDRTYFIVMEYIDGEPLSAIIRSQAPLPAARAAGIAADIAKALSYAHRHGVVHRDVKPGNVLITRDGQVKVADFGIARAIGTDDNVTQTGLVMGTATYFSPEQAQGLGVDGRSDVYSLGVVLYEMVTGRPPFSADTPVAIAYQHVSEAPIPPRDLEPKVPVALEAVIMRAMAKQPSDRYPTAEDFHADLQRYVQGAPVAALAGVGAGIGAGVAGAAGVADGMGATQALIASPTTAFRATGAGAGGEATVATPLHQRSEVVEGRAGAAQPEMPKRRWIAWLLIGILLAAALGALVDVGGRWLGYFGAQGYFPMPNVEEQQYMKGAATLLQDGLKLKPHGIHNKATRGIVLNESPGPNKEVQRGDTVLLTYSLGPSKVEIPPLLQRQYRDAESRLQHLGLKVTLVPQPPTTASEPQGIVVKTSPPPYARVLPGATVKVYYVQGAQQVKVPSVTKLTVAAATLALANHQLQVSGQQSQTSASVPAGLVIATNPAAGNTETAGSAVLLYVSSGPPVPVPNVQFKTQQAAEDALRAVGLVPNVVDAAGPPGQAGLVLSQSPAAGISVATGSTVQITVDVPPATTTTTTAKPPPTSTTTTTVPKKKKHGA